MEEIVVPRVEEQRRLQIKQQLLSWKCSDAKWQQRC